MNAIINGLTENKKLWLTKQAERYGLTKEEVYNTNKGLKNLTEGDMMWLLKEPKEVKEVKEPVENEDFGIRSAAAA